MKNILIFILCLVGLSVFGAGEPLQRQAFTTNTLPATIDSGGSTIHNTLIDSTVTGNASGLTSLTASSLTGTVAIANGGTASATGNAVSLTNVSLQDGGFGDEWGSPTAMNNTLTQGPTVDAMGNSISWALGGDNALIYINHSTNFLNNGGFGNALTGYGTSGATVLGRTQGPTFSYISTNETDGFVNAAGEIVFNYDASLMRIFALVSPGGGLIGSDSINYAGWIWDVEHHLFGVPLIPGGTTNGGCNQPDSIVWDFTATAPTNAPTFYNDGYRDSAGKVFTAYSNNAAKTHLFFMSSSAGNPVASGTLTKFSSGGASDATIAYSAVTSNRTWNGWTFTADNQTGNVGIYSNVTATNGSFTTTRAHANTAGSPNPQFAHNPSTVDFNNGALSQNGMTVYVTRGGAVLGLGSSSHHNLSMFATGQGWNTGTSVVIGDDDLDDLQNFGQSTLEVHGSLGTYVTNTVANYVFSMLDSTVLVNGSGTLTVTLPDATFHCKGRQYVIKNTGTTNQTVLTTSSQTIDGKTGYTNAPNGSITIQCDAVGWQIIEKYLGNPTNITTVTATGITNTWNWPGTAYVLGTAIAYTNFNNAGIAVFTNTTLVNDSQAIHVQAGGFIRAASGLSGTMVANGN